MDGQLGSDATLVRGAGASALAHSPTSPLAWWARRTSSDVKRCGPFLHHNLGQSYLWKISEMISVIHVVLLPPTSG